MAKSRLTKRAPRLHGANGLTLETAAFGGVRTSQAFFYASAFFWLDGFTVPAPAPLKHTIGDMPRRPRSIFSNRKSHIPKQRRPALVPSREQGQSLAEGSLTRGCLDCFRCTFRCGGKISKPLAVQAALLLPHENRHLRGPARRFEQRLEDLFDLFGWDVHPHPITEGFEAPCHETSFHQPFDARGRCCPRGGIDDLLSATV